MQKQTITIHYFAFIHKKTVEEARDKATNTSCACKKERNLNAGGNRLLTRCCCALLRSFPNLIRSKDWFPMFPFILVAVRMGIAELVLSTGFDCWKARGFTESREEKQTSLQSFTKEHEIDWTILKMKERVGESGSSIQIEFGGLGQEVKKYSRGDCFYAKCIV